ncbi:acyl-CoA synthetase [Wenjunlia vitaminophila]|uniref:Acyl-CoA synthetase n=1 Tax=Wenjunlia vitaminophila TaxID=76728 RepID=A0A0T6LZ85_WENVI|nr:GNAT family N-acetyltransferase [Wenjunlia vitaminophila]KRV51435.1 acyl-CoA synthetase [Wenjunlia vitaminophila]
MAVSAHGGGHPSDDPEPAYPEHWEADVVLRDGGTAHIRPITPADADRLVAFYAQVSDTSKYYRFFAPYPRLSDRDVRRFTHHDYVDRVGLAATVGDEFIATVRYDRIDDRGRGASGGAQAEVAFLVQDAHQGRGVASALMEHIAAVARERGIRRFVAEVLPENRKMTKVFTDAGYTQRRSFEEGVVHLELELEPTDASLEVMRARELRAEARSVRRLLAPRSVAVVGASRQPGGVGRTILANLLAAGYTGRVYAVNSAFAPGTATLHPEGVPAYRSVADLPEPVDLAVLAVPAEQALVAATQCGTHGVQGLLAVGTGFAETGEEGRERQRELVRRARADGMRVIGPNAFGIANQAPDVRLNATLSPELPRPGRVGLFTQSGAIGIALLAGVHRSGLGLSSFVSAGNRADVSGNDLLQYWHEDPATRVVLMYLESFGNPRKFTRLARRTARSKPVVVVKGGRHTGSSVPAGHAVPTTRMPDATADDLFLQAGVIRVDNITDLLDVGLLLDCQPLPPGDRVTIVGNSGSLGAVAHDACLTGGLRPAQPHDLTTGADTQDFRAAVAAALADPGTDAVLVTAIPPVSGGDSGPHWDASDLARELRNAATGAGKPVVVTHLALDDLPALLLAEEDADEAPDVDEATDVDADADGYGGARSVARVPAYPAPERAARALAEAATYARWRRAETTPGQVPQFEDIDVTSARTQVAALLAAHEEHSERPMVLAPADASRLLVRYGIRLRTALAATDADSAVGAARLLGYPVALKTTAEHLRHRADLGGVRLDLADEENLRRAFRDLTTTLGAAGELRLVVQSMAPRGVDTVIRAAVDPALGAVLSFGLAGPPSELLGDVAHRLVPATDRDVAALVRSIKGAPLLFGYRGAEPVDTAALEDLLLRVSLLVHDLPEVAAVDLEPVVAARTGLAVLGATVRLARPPARDDLGPRRLSWW